jgi:hypothetical protein
VTALLALSLIPKIADAQNMTLPINITNKTSTLDDGTLLLNQSNIAAQGNLSENINRTFNTSLANNAMLSNG